MTISSTTRKAGPYIGNGTASVFPFAFKVFQASDVEVVRLNVSTNVETTLALTTDYTVSLNQDQDSNPGGSITLVAGALATGYNLVITSDVENLQPTDLTNQGGFYPDVINDALDRATIQIQQLQEGLDRAALLPITSSADAASLVADIVRLADSADNLDIDANNIDAINTVATNITNVNTVATDIANVNAVAANKTNIDAVNANKTNIDAVGSDLLEPVSEINTVAVNIANVNTVGDNISNVNAVAGNSTNINAVAGNATNINAVNANKANIDAVAGNNSNITAVAGNATNINAVNANSANINAVAGNATNINAVNANSANINTVAGSNTSVTTVATNITAVNSAYTNLAAILDAPTQAANAANSAAAAAASAASGMYSAVQDKSANYTIVAADAGDLIRVTTTSGAITITLPLIGSTGIGDGFKIAVVKWTADANAVNIARSGSDTINGATSAQIGSQYSQIILVADAVSSTWFTAQAGLGATNINVDTFSGNGSTVAFTLTSDPSTKNNTSVFISGVYQQKSTYSLSGTTLTFSTAPPSGTANIEVAYSTPLAIGTPSDGTVSTSKIVDGAVTAVKMGTDAPLGVSDKANSSTGYFDFPSGTTAQRPASPNSGFVRFNTTIGSPEIYDGSNWQTIKADGGTSSYFAEVLIIAGGGGGKGESGGGGGGGGLVNLRTSFNSATAYTCTVGAGGGSASSGGSSSISGTGFTTLSADGGGVGGGSGGVSTNGGSGGGGGYGNYLGGQASGLLNINIGSNGGSNFSNAGRHGAGGGGAGKQGNATTGTDDKYNGAGGDGLWLGEWNVAGMSGDGYFAGGGGGGGEYYTGSTNKTVSSIGGAGGGGAGCYGGVAFNGGTNGRANVGGGAGGQSGNSSSGLSGGSGVVIIRYLGIQRGTGGTIHSSNGYTYHTFTSSGTFTA